MTKKQSQHRNRHSFGMRRACVVGASRGLGLALAKRLVGEPSIRKTTE